MKKFVAPIWCILCGLLCLGLWGCGEEQAAEPVGSVYQIWLSNEWRPAYLHWLGAEALLVGSVEAEPGPEAQRVSYVEALDLQSGSAVNASVGSVTENWFLDVRAVPDLENGVVYLHNKFNPAAGLCFGSMERMCYGCYTPQTAYPVAFMLGEQRLGVEQIWDDWLPTGWLLEIAPGRLTQLVDLGGEHLRELANNPQLGGEYMVDYDVSPDQRLYVQVSFDGVLMTASLEGNGVQSSQLALPEGWVSVSAVRILPDNSAAAVTVLCEDRTVVQLWGLGVKPELLGEVAGEPGEDLLLLAAVDADRLLLQNKRQVKLLNWRQNRVEKIYDAGEYLKLRWGCQRLAAPDNLHLLLDPERTQGLVQYAAYAKSSNRLAVIKYFPAENVSQLIVLDNWQ